MTQLKFGKTLLYTMLTFAATAFTACVDDDVDEQGPMLELSEATVAFSGTATEDATVTVKSNRQWTVAYEDEETQKEWMYFKVTGDEVSPGIYNGDGTVKITVGESAQPHSGRLVFTLSNSYGVLFTEYLTVTQGNYVPPTVGPVGKLVAYIMGDSRLSGAVGSNNAMPLQYSESTIEAVILANDAAGNNNRKLYVGDNNGLEKSAIVLYGADFAMANDPTTKYPVGAKVTLNLQNANYYAFNNVRQLTDVAVTVGEEKVELVVPSLSVDKFNSGDYQAQYVKLNNMTPEASWVGKSWTTANAAQSVILNDAAGKTLTVYMNQGRYATGFADMYVADKTGTIYGVAETYRENAQLIPTKKADIEALSSSEGGGTEPDPTPGDAIYYESFGTADVAAKPLVADYTGWAKTGSGAADVTYTGEGNLSIRATGKLSAGYEGASGKNKAFFGTNNPALIINKIKLDGAQDLQLTFGAAYSKRDEGTGTYDNVFKPALFHLSLSADGTNWKAVEFTYAQADEYWVFATSKFKLKEKADYLYVKYAVDEVSVFAIDDVRLAAGSGGAEIDLGSGGDTPGPEPVDPTHIVLDFTRGANMATPAFPYHDKDDSSSATEGTYTIDGYTYTIKASSDGKFYWFHNNYNAETKPETVYDAFFIGKAGAYIELPAIEGKALTKVVLTGASGASSTCEAAVTDAAGADVAGGLSQLVGQGTATYELSGTSANTSYRIAITKNNCQFAKIELFYGDGGQTPTPSEPTLTVAPASLSFAAKDSAKTIACTAANADGYAVGAESSDAANFAVAVSGTTVTVTPTENTGSARNATITVYLTNDSGATKVAAKSVAVTQAAAGGSTEPSGSTYDKITSIAGLADGMTGFIGGEPGGTYGLQLINGMATYGQAFTSKYTYDETAKTLTQAGDYEAVTFTLEAVSGGFNIKVGTQYLIGTVVLDNKKPKQALAFSDTPANAWVFEDYNGAIVAKTDASNDVGTFNGMYMMLAKTASSRFIRAYASLNATSGAGFWFFKKN